MKFEGAWFLGRTLPDGGQEPFVGPLEDSGGGGLRFTYLDAAGNGSFIFPAERFPHGPVNVRIYAHNRTDSAGRMIEHGLFLLIEFHLDNALSPILT